MKSELTAKFLQHLNLKKKDGGFTLIELLVVIIIIGILSAIALPAFLNQANKAKQSEAKTTVGSMNRAQQALYMEKGAFASSSAEDFGKLGLGVATETTNYKYTISGGGKSGAGTSATVATLVTNQAQPITNAIKAYVGGVQQGSISATSEATTLVRLCEATKAKGVTGFPTGAQTVTGTTDGTPPTCPTDYEAL
ncbi:MAG: type IV pilin-like G/H family protein [Myxacorys californica WJT36-NPBG1]|jgi:prepilin-type N-terminal cleavage/methylation domain-containing protein|nr:type IV pilin-like G/H family protein [Myxacorys californica WJT36-NPBG1]